MQSVRSGDQFHREQVALIEICAIGRERINLID